MRPLLIACALLFAAGLAGTERLRVCATTTDLAALARAVGGDDVEVTAFARGRDDPHFIEPRPTFIRDLARAEVLIEVGLELEIGWLPPLVQQAGNARLQPGQPGRIVAAEAIRPLGVPTGPVDRSQGDVHAHGNPHFLLDPVRGWLVARLLRDRFAQVRPAAAAAFAQRTAAFEAALARELLGEAAVAALGGAEQALALADREAALAKLQAAGVEPGGWTAALARAGTARVVADHDQWPYVAARYGIVVAGFLEPKPGVPPTSRHLAAVAETMRTQGVRVVLVSPFFDRKPAEIVAQAAGARVVTVAHQAGALADTDDYLAWQAHTVRVLAEALTAP